MFNPNRNSINNIREEDRQWFQDLSNVVEKINAKTAEDSVAQLRQFAKTGLLVASDVYLNPERFFIAHRLIAGKATKACRR
jgi:hypothetical protein